jgi:phage-related protein
VTVIGTADIAVRADTSRFKEDAATGIRSSILGAAKTIATTLGVAYGTAKVVEFGKQAIDQAAQFQKASEEVSLYYGQQAKSVTAFANSATSGYAISRSASTEFAAQIGHQAELMGLNRKQAAAMSIEFQKFSGAVGKIQGQDPSQYFQALEKSMLGNTRGLKNLGVATTSASLAQELFNHHVQLSAADQNKVQAAHLKVAAAVQTLDQAQTKYGKGSLQAQTAANALQGAQDAYKKSLQGTTSTMTPANKALAIYYTLLDHQNKLSQDAAKHQNDYANEIVYLKAVFQNVQLAIGQFLVRALTPLVRAFATYLPKALQFFSKEWGRLHTAIVSSGLMKAFQQLAALVRGTLVQTFESLWKATQHLAGALAPLASQLAPLAKLFAEIVAALAVGVFIAAAKAIQGIADAISAIPAPILRALAVGVGAVVAAFTAWLGIQAAVYGSMVLLNNGLDLVAAGFAALDASAIIWIAAIAAVAIAAYEIYTHWNTVRGLLEGVWKAITSAFTAAWDFIKGVTSAFLGWLSSHWQLILAILVGPIGIAVLLIKNHWNTIVNATQAAWGAVKGAIQSVVSWIAGVAGTILGIATRIGSAIVSGIANGLSTLGSTVRRLVGAVGGILSGLYNSVQQEAESIGSAIVRGIWNGIQSLASWLVGQIKSFTGGLLSGAKSFLGIGSPSKVFADEVGVPIAQGIALGITQGAGAVGDAVAAAVRGAIPQGQAAIPAAGAAVGGALGGQVVINGMTVVAQDPQGFMAQLNQIAKTVA